MLIWLIPNPFENPALTIFLILLNLLILVWQVVGTLRSGDNHLKSDNSSVLVMASYFVIVGACYIAVLQSADWLSGNKPVKITEASLRTRPLPQLNQDQSKILLEGTIDFELNNSIRHLLNENKSIETIVLNSNGGAIYAARAIAIQIIEKQLDTHIDGTCNSACTLIFMAGNKRTISKDGSIGFHQYKDEQMNPLNTNKVSKEQEKDLKFFKERGASETFLKTLFQAKHNDIWIPDADLLKREGITTGN